MKILLFASPAFYGDGGISSPYNGGGWMYTIQKELNKRSDIELAIAFDNKSVHKLTKEYINGFLFYSFPVHKKSLKNKIRDLICYKNETLDKDIWPFYTDNYKQIIKDFNPDIIHVFGSEQYRQLVPVVAGDIPTLIHIQGLLSLYIYSVLPPGVSKWSYIWKDRNLKMAYKNFQELVNWRRSVYREKAILKACTHVLGRTEWDRSALQLLNPNAKYHYGGEILRPEFYDQRERIIPLKHIIISVSSNPLYKGLDLVLRTAEILKKEIGLDFEWKIFGNVDISLAERVTGIQSKEVNIEICGVATAEQLCGALSTSTLYFQSSYVENSPNSIAEAQILGIPVVATNVGGTSSMVEQGKTGFLFPPMDPYMGAYYIQKICNSKELNTSIGDQAHKEALKRHKKDEIISSLLSTYNDIIRL